jgi:PelA/Pel-15E family pectate lyase
VNAGVAWLKKTAIYGQAYVRGPEGRHLASQPDAGPTWARFYSIGADLPIFGDRDKSLHDDVDEISRERRDGYSWYTPAAKEALDRYATWSAERSTAR